MENRLKKITEDVQEYLIRKIPRSLIAGGDGKTVRSYISRYIDDEKITVGGYTKEELKQRLFNEVCGFSVISPLLEDDTVEEININSWDDIAVMKTDGENIKLKEHFFDREHATDIVKKLLLSSHMSIDNAKPISYGNLKGNIRITAIKAPVVNEDDGVSVSIRILRTGVITTEKLEEDRMLSPDMSKFLYLCLRYGVSVVICGRTSSGKTTLMNAMLEGLPKDKRIFTIEAGSREIDLKRRDEEGNILSNVVQTLTRPSDIKENDISEEDLVSASLRFDPDIICVGEMRDIEAHSAIEASTTDHTVITTVHGAGGKAAHQRIAFLSQKRFPIDINMSLRLAQEAFPITVFCHRLENNERKVMEIAECHDFNGKMKYRTLFRYNVSTKQFENYGEISEELYRRFLLYGCPPEELSGVKTSI